MITSPGLVDASTARVAEALRKVAAHMRLTAPKEAETMTEFTAQCEIANAFDDLASELEAMTDEAKVNTDREIWCEREGDFYADSIHVTEGGGIGIDCGGYVIVMPVREWHRLAASLRPSISVHGGPPQAWLAPWEASEVMYAAAEETNRGGGIADGGGGEPDIYDLEEVWSAMRTAHLAKED